MEKRNYILNRIIRQTVAVIQIDVDYRIFILMHFFFNSNLFSYYMQIALYKVK